MIESTVQQIDHHGEITTLLYGWRGNRTGYSLDTAAVILGVAGIGGTLGGAILGYLLPRRHEKSRAVYEAIVEVWEKLELIENSPILWHPDIFKKMDPMIRRQSINRVKRVCADIKHLLARTAIPHTEEVVWAVMDVSEILTIVQLPLKYDPGRIRRVAQVRQLLQQEIENQQYVEAMNKYFGTSARELEEKYGVKSHLVTEDHTTHASDETGLETIKHCWWHLRREEKCRHCHPKTGRH